MQDRGTIPGSGGRGARRESRGIWLLLAGLAAIATAAGLALLLDVFEKRQEAKHPFFRVVELTDETEDPETWGKNFPLQYDGYLRSVDMERTRFGGSEALPRSPVPNAPRTATSPSRLEEDPRLKTMWAGYAFAVDSREERGHAFMLEEQIYTRRQDAAKQPGACLHCHASVYVPYRELGDGDLFAGFDRLSRMPYAEARQQVHHPVSCIDCHDPETLQLRITRPGFLEGIRALKASEGVADYDPNSMATRQEMRSYVCGQCHVEYFFSGDEKRLTYPWAKGLGAEQILAYYDEIGFSDWTHATTGAVVLKAQHPEFELWSQGTHARAGVACADCHMPYQRVGAQKISDHHVRSPLLNVANACQTCHRVPEAELLARADTIQERTRTQLDVALDALLDLIADLDAARAAGAPDGELGAARAMQRRAQFLLDFVQAESSMGFHAGQEAVRLLGLSIDASRKGQNALRALPTHYGHAPSTPTHVTP